MKIFLHIGANKTGSTALQSCLHRNRKWLSRQGVLWPETGLLNHAHYTLAAWLGFAQGRVGQLTGADLTAARDGLLREIENSGAHTVIISAETFMLRRDTAPMRAFLEGFDVEVVALLRRHDSWWPSVWAQAVKTVENPPWGRSFESFLKFQEKRGSQHFCFRRLVESWETNFPGNVRPLAYERSRAPDGVVPFFFDAIGLPDLSAELPAKPVESNVTPRVDVLGLVDLLRRSTEIPESRRNALISRALSCDGQGPTASEFISGRLRRSLTEAHADAYEYLDKRFAPEGETFFRDPLPEDDGKDGLHELPSIAAIEILINQVFNENPISLL